MHLTYWCELTLLLRLLGAGLCGAIIGYERTARLKEAGVRTHLIVAMGAALFTILSKYGFNEMLDGANGMTLDPSRVAASIVTGVGFLGAGIIFLRDQTITGLTTAAGIWATAGIGMAVGTGLYFVGGLGTVMIYIIQIMLHKHFIQLREPGVSHLTLRIAKNNEGLEFIREALGKECRIVNCMARQMDDDTMLVKFSIKAPNAYNYVNMLDLLKNNPNIKSMSITSTDF